MHPSHRDFYQKLRDRVNAQAEKVSAKYGKKVAGWVLLLPDLFALCVRLTFDPRVSFASKGLLGVAVLYLISPIDLLPDGLLTPLGLIDDFAFVILALHKMKESQTDPDILRELWAGDGDIIELIDDVAGKLSDFVDKKVIARIRKVLSKS